MIINGVCRTGYWEKDGVEKIFQKVGQKAQGSIQKLKMPQAEPNQRRAVFLHLGVMGAPVCLSNLRKYRYSCQERQVRSSCSSDVEHSGRGEESCSVVKVYLIPKLP